MSEYLALSDDEKVELLPEDSPYDEVTEDKGICSICQGEAMLGISVLGVTS